MTLLNELLPKLEKLEQKFFRLQKSVGVNNPAFKGIVEMNYLFPVIIIALCEHEKLEREAEAGRILAKAVEGISSDSSDLEVCQDIRDQREMALYAYNAACEE